MAYFLDTSAAHEATSSNVKYFKADTEADVANLPTNLAEGVQQGVNTVLHLKCAPGSECFVLDPPSVYMLNSSGEWLEL